MTDSAATPSPAARAAMLAIRAYQRLLSPLLCALLGPTCRFYPSCSEYARQAFATRPFARALGLSLRRLARCHPFHPGGYDPLDETPPEARPDGCPTETEHGR